MRISARRALVAAVLAAGMAAGGAATAVASEPDDQDGPLGGLTDSLSGGAEQLQDTLGNTPGGDTSDEGGSGDPAPGLGDVEDMVTDGAEQLPGGGDSPLQPVTDLVCELTDDQVALLGECPEDAVGYDKDEDEYEDKDEHEDKDVTYAEPVDVEPEPSDDVHDGGNDDSGTVPVGGIETGGGGTA